MGRKSYTTYVTQDLLESVEKPQWHRMLYMLMMLYTTTQERRNFGPIGWCVPYEFNDSDMSATAEFIQKFLDASDPKKPITWSTVRYMMCEVMFGGRITDDLDRRLMNTYGEQWGSDNCCFTEGWTWKAGDMRYSIPDAGGPETGGISLAKINAFIDEIPPASQDVPEVYGMHGNADLTRRTAEAVNMLETILSIQPKDSGGGGGETREEFCTRTAQELLSRLPPNYNKDEYRATVDKKLGGRNPLNIFLIQEVDRIQKVMGLVKRNMKNLQEAIRGEIIMTSDLIECLNSMYDAKVPAHWIVASQMELSGWGFWVADFMKRCEQYSGWLENGRPKVYWLTGWFNPQAFITAMRQEKTRSEKGWALDNVSVRTEVIKYEHDEVRAAPDDGLYIYGLSLDGARWDKKMMKLVESEPKVLFVGLPVVHVTGVNDLEAKKERKDLYSAPTYTTKARNDIRRTMWVSLPSDKPAWHWTLRGVACLQSIN